MFCFLRLCFGTLIRLLRSRRSLLLDNLTLRQQLVVLKRRHPRAKLDLSDKLKAWIRKKILDYIHANDGKGKVVYGIEALSGFGKRAALNSGRFLRSCQL